MYLQIMEDQEDAEQGTSYFSIERMLEDCVVCHYRLAICERKVNELMQQDPQRKRKPVPKPRVKVFTSEELFHSTLTSLAKI